MSQRPPKPVRKSVPKKASQSPPASPPESTLGPPPSPPPPPPPPPVDQPDWAITAARNAVTVAARAPAASHQPIPVPGAFQLDTGLVDYGMWIEMFTHTNAAPPKAEDQSYQRGRIWS